MNSVHFAKESYMAEWIPKPEIDGFGGKQDDSTIRDEVVREIINSSPKGICSKALKRMYGSALSNWLPKLMENDYQTLKENENVTTNFDSVEALNVTFKFRKCKCGGHKCKEYYALDRKVDPALDLGVPAHQVIFHMPTWEMTQKEFKASLHSFFNDPTNILAREIDRFIEEERLEEMGVDPELYLDASDYEEEYE